MLNSVYKTATPGHGGPGELRLSMDANKQWLRTDSKSKSELLQIPYPQSVFLWKYDALSAIMIII